VKHAEGICVSDPAGHRAALRFVLPWPTQSSLMLSLRSTLLATAAFMLLFTGCLTIEEHYTFKKNGSGTMEYVVDMSEVGELMKTLSEMGEGDGIPKTTDDMGTLDMADEMAALKKIDGISKVKLDAKKKWVQRLKFDFKDINALNNALNILMPDSLGRPHTFFRWEGNTLVRTNNRHAYELGAGMARESGEDGEEEGADMGAFLEAMKYRYSFKFANDISTTEMAHGVNKEAAGNRVVKFDTDWSVISRDENALDLKIVLDR
jgi:hypothetical protein